MTNLVISNMIMPKMMGDRLAKEMISIRSDIPVICCTGFSTGRTEEIIRDMGIKGFLMKPITIGQIFILFRKVLDETKGPTQALLSKR